MAVLIRLQHMCAGMPAWVSGWHAVRLWLLSGLLLLLAVRVEAAGVGEYQVKAAMVYNMTKFVEWPGDTANVPGAALQLCVVGNGALGKAVESLQGLESRGKKINVRPLAKADEVSSCQVVVIGETDKRRMLQMLEAAADKEILTVSELPRFAANGGMIGLVAEGGRVRFEINQLTAKRAKLKISSQLLKLARIVAGE